MADVGSGSAFQRALANEMKRTSEAIIQQLATPLVLYQIYADMTDEEREAIAQRARVRNLIELEETVEAACQAIYDQHEGYWPSPHERHVIAIALLSHECDPW